MPVVDLAFRLTGSKVPVDHGYALYSAISRIAPDRQVWFEASQVLQQLGVRTTYEEAPSSVWYLGLFPKLGSELARSILTKMLTKPPLGKFASGAGKTIYIHRVMTTFVKCFDFVSYFRNDKDGVKKSEDYKPYSFSPNSRAEIALPILNSSAFFFCFVALGDCFHCGKEFVLQFPCDFAAAETGNEKTVGAIGHRLIRGLKRNTVRRRAVSEMTGAVEYDEFWPSKSKPIIDEIDTVFAAHYGFTPEELDFIVNYDIKYRMGRQEESAEEAIND